MIEIIPLDAIDSKLIEALLDQSFGPERKARTIYRVREGLEPLPALSFAAANEEGTLLGSIQCWPVKLTDEHGKGHPMILVGPVAVAHDHQDQGVGRALMAAVFAGLGEQETMPLVLLGDPEYYGRHFGYSAEHTGGWQLPGPFEQHRLLARSRPEVDLPKKGMLGPWQGR